jgi:hypothetical protein
VLRRGKEVGWQETDNQDGGQRPSLFGGEPGRIGFLNEEKVRDGAASI